MGFLANVIHPAFLLVHGDEQVAGVDNVALAHIDAGNGAVLRSADLVLHLHGLEDQQGVASLDGVTGLDLDIQDIAGHGSGDGDGTGGTGRSGSRCRSKSCIFRGLYGGKL